MKKIYMILAAAVLAFGCSKDDTTTEESVKTGSVSVDVAELLFDASGAALNNGGKVTVKASGEWRIVGDMAWCEPSVKQGTNGAEITFATKENTEQTGRSEKFTIVCDNVAAEINVEQEPVSHLELISKSVFDVSSGDDIVSVRIKKNVDIEFVISEEDSRWIRRVGSVSRAAAPELIYEQFTIAANDTYDERTAIITLKAGSLEETLTINQAKNVGVVIENKNISAPMDGGLVTIELLANDEYTVSVPSEFQSWVSVAPASRGLVSSTIQLSVQAATMTRVAPITITPRTSGGVAATFMVRQQSTDPQYIEIADEAFRKVLLNKGYVALDADGKRTELTQTATELTSLSISNMGIKSLAGIEHFTALTSIDCSYNALTELDFSANTKLTSISCQRNYELASLNVNGCAELTTLNCSYAKLASVDLSNNPLLKTLNVSYGHFKTLDLRNNPVISSVSMSRNAWEVLHLGKYSSVSLASGLRDYSGEYSTKLTITGEDVNSIYINNNKLLSLDVSGCPALVRLAAYSNPDLATLNIGNLTKLNVLQAYTTALTTVNLSQCGELQSVNIRDAALVGTLDLSNCSSVVTMVDVRGNAKLEKIVMLSDQTVGLIYKETTTTVEYREVE